MAKGDLINLPAGDTVVRCERLFKRKLILVVLLGAGVTSFAEAQEIRGRIVLPDSITPVGGIVITAIQTDGAQRTSTLSSSTGSYLLRLPRAGRYDLRVLRIGYRPMILTGIEVAADSLRVRNVVLELLPVAIAGMSVRDNADCSLRGQDAETFLRLWEQARGALDAARLSESSEALTVHLMRVDGRVDAMRYHAPDKVGVSRPETDSASYRDWIADRVFAATPVDTLADAGYVRRLPSGGTVYDAPSADALLDDRFLQTHCFGVVGAPKEHETWIGIAFTPRATREGVVDVAGVLWLDRSTAELRQLEFSYANLPPESYRLCTVPSHTRGSVCQTFVEKGLNRFGVGGDAHFERLSSGEWFVKRLTIYSVSSEYAMRPSSRTSRANMGEPCRPEQVVVRQFPRVGDCIYLNWMVPRLSTVSTTAIRILRDGEEIFQDDSSLVDAERFMRKQAGTQPVSLTGVVTDHDGRPLRSVIVQTEQPARRAALTDSLGTFRISWLPPGEVIVSFRCASYEPVRATLPLSKDTTRNVSLALQPIRDTSTQKSDCASPH